MIPDVFMGDKIYSLDGLRGCAIILVLLAHFNHMLNNEVIHFVVGAGTMGVYVFFVLSGFLITALLIKEKIKHGRIAIKKFYFRRVLRIFPVAYLFIFVIFVLNFFLCFNIRYLDFGIPALFLANFSSILVIPYFFNHFWSLSVEEQFYLWIPNLINWNLRGFKILILILFFSSFVFRFLFFSFKGLFWAVLFDITRSIDGLIIGSFFALMLYSGLLSLTFIRKFKIVICTFCVLAVFFLNSEVHDFYFKMIFNHSFYSFFIAVFIVANIEKSNDYFFKLLNSRVMQKIGVLSYSIYIWQQLFLTELFGFYGILWLFCVSIFSYYIFERPIINLKYKFRFSTD